MKVKSTFKGFALIEVLIAMVIISVGLLSLAKFQSNIMRSNLLAKERTKAVIFAQDGIEVYRSLAVDLADNSTLGGNAVTKTDISNSSPYRTTEFTRTQEIKKLENGDIEIAMTVTWPDLNNEGAASEETTVSLTSVISRQAINDAAAKLMLRPSVGFTCFSGLQPGLDGMC